MKKFFKYTVLFLLPVVLLLIALEVAVHTIPNSYSYKYKYVKTNGKNIKAVGIGHSQFYDDFKSDSFFLPAFNLSNSAQGYMEDYYLLRELLPYMPNLEMVLLPIASPIEAFSLSDVQLSLFWTITPSLFSINGHIT